jgi:hypothetical protein
MEQSALLSVSLVVSLNGQPRMNTMRILSGLRAGLIAAVAVMAAGLASTAHAVSGRIQITVV